MTGLNIASRESMKSAQALECSRMSSLDKALQEVHAESSILILASMTEFIISHGDCGTVTSTINPVFVSFATEIGGFSNLKVGIAN